MKQQLEKIQEFKSELGRLKALEDGHSLVRSSKRPSDKALGKIQELRPLLIDRRILSFDFYPKADGSVEICLFFRKYEKSDRSLQSFTISVDGEFEHRSEAEIIQALKEQNK